MEMTIREWSYLTDATKWYFVQAVRRNQWHTIRMPASGQLKQTWPLIVIIQRHRIPNIGPIYAPLEPTSVGGLFWANQLMLSSEKKMKQNAHIRRKRIKIRPKTKSNEHAVERDVYTWDNEKKRLSCNLMGNKNRKKRKFIKCIRGINVIKAWENLGDFCLLFCTYTFALNSMYLCAENEREREMKEKLEKWTNKNINLKITKWK